MRTASVKSKRLAEKTKELRSQIMAVCEEIAKAMPADFYLPSNAEGKIQQYRRDREHYKATLEQRGFSQEVGFLSFEQTVSHSLSAVVASCDC